MIFVPPPASFSTAMSCPSRLAHPAPAPDTTAWRVLDGRSLAGAQFETRVDNFAGHWLVQTRDVDFPDELRGLCGRIDGVKSLWWKRLSRDEKGRAGEAPQWIEGEKLSGRFAVTEHGVRYLADFGAGYSQGIFLDQRLNRAWVRERCSDGDRVLNTFAYTGAFSVVSALGGAVTTTLDLSNPYLQWARDNFAGNDIDSGEHYFCRGDALEWMARFARQGRRFRGVILDPPSFSRTGKGKAFSVTSDYVELVRLAGQVLEPDDGWLLACCNHHDLREWKFSEQVAEGLDLAGCRVRDLEMAAMPGEFGADDYLKSCRVVVG